VAGRVGITDLARKKRDGDKIVAVVAWDHHMARIADRVGVDIVSVGDTVGMNLWGRSNPFDMSVDEMVLVSRAVRTGVTRALVSADFPFGPLQEGTTAAVRAATRLVKDAGVDLVKLDGASDYPDAVTEIARAGIPVWAQFGVTPQRALRFGLDYATMAGTDAQLPQELTDDLVAEAKQLEQAGATLLDFTNSGPVVGAAVARSVTIPVLGGFGGGPWLDGRVRMAHAAIGYAATGIDAPPDTYANVAQIAFEALTELVSDVRAGRQIRGGVPVPPQS
jgi:3-methyl-2-oxobutanoate hydroxymethyltransferase